MNITLNFSAEEAQLSQEDYDKVLNELATIVAGFPDLTYDKLQDMSSVSAKFMLDIIGKDQTHEDLKDMLKISAASYIYIMQLTTTIVQTMRELDAYKNGDAPPNPDTKIVLQ